MNRKNRRLSQPPALVRVVYRALCAIASLALSAQAAWPAEEKPLWELGLGVAALSFPAYRGSDQSSSLLLPAPYFVYRGEFLKADRNGVRGQLFESERIDLSIWHNAQRTRQLNLLLPLRAAFTLNNQPQSIDMGLQTGLLFGDQRQHRYFYDVDAAYATAKRPAYQVGGGYAGMQYLMALSRRYPKYWLGAFARFDDLQGVSFAASSLMRTRQYVAAGVAVSWLLGESATRVMTND